MKNTFVILMMLLLASVLHAQENPQISWSENFEEAKALAHQTGKPILISFAGSDWCAPCIRLDRDFFNTNEFADFAAEKLVLLRLDFPARKKNQLSAEQLAHNEALAEIYNKQGSFPLVLIVDENGAVKGRMSHPSKNVEDYLSSLTNIIEYLYVK